jgi:hypothetical protein
MQLKQINLGGAAPTAGVGCGGLLFLLGLILVSPVGEWLIKGIGWIFIVMGVFAIGTGIYFWIKGSRNRCRSD